jgi:hypothetical protein
MVTPGPLSYKSSLSISPASWQSRPWPDAHNFRNARPLSLDYMFDNPAEPKGDTCQLTGSNSWRPRHHPSEIQKSDNDYFT